MIKVETDTIGAKMLTNVADFSDIMNASGNVDEFTVNVGIELKSAVLAAIVAAQDEYLRVIQSKTENQIPTDLVDSLKETIFDFVQDIDQDEIEQFRKMTSASSLN